MVSRMSSMRIRSAPTTSPRVVQSGAPHGAREPRRPQRRRRRARRAHGRPPAPSPARRRRAPSARGHDRPRRPMPIVASAPTFATSEGSARISSVSTSPAPRTRSGWARMAAAHRPSAPVAEPSAPNTRRVAAEREPVGAHAAAVDRLLRHRARHGLERRAHRHLQGMRRIEVAGRRPSLAHAQREAERVVAGAHVRERIAAVAGTALAGRPGRGRRRRAARPRARRARAARGARRRPGRGGGRRGRGAPARPRAPPARPGRAWRRSAGTRAARPRPASRPRRPRRGR